MGNSTHSGAQRYKVRMLTLEKKSCVGSRGAIVSSPKRGCHHKSGGDIMDVALWQRRSLGEGPSTGTDNSATPEADARS